MVFFIILELGFLKKKSKIIVIFLAMFLVTITSYALVDFTTQSNNNNEGFLKDVKNDLDYYLKDIPQRKDNQIFEENIKILHAEIDKKINQSKIVENKQIHQMIKESNDIFSKLDSPKEFIYQIEEQWESSDPDNPNSSSYNLINNPVADMLRDIIHDDQKSENKFKYVEIFVTNSYGANVAQSNKTSDYLQSDEIWWKEARENGLFVEEGYFDDSAGVYAAEIAMAITDDQGNFIGVIKMVLNIESIDQNKMFINQWAYTLFR